MRFEKLVQDYASDLKKEIKTAKSSREFTPELSFRPVLDKFFRKVSKAINKNLSVVYEPRKQMRSGHPDWRFHHNKSLALIGYVEAKALDEKRPIDLKSYQKQINKYLTLGSQLILTDGIEFIFFDPKEPKPKRLFLLKKPVNWKKVEHDIQIEQAFKTFFEFEGFRKCSEVQIVEEAAKRCVQMSNAIEEMAELSEDEAVDSDEKQAIKVLNSLKTLILNHHNPALRSSKEFADFVSQVLIFGLLYSHRVIRDDKLTPPEVYEKIHDFWVKVIDQNESGNLRPFRALIMQMKGELNSLSRIGVWYDDFRLFLSHIKLESRQISTPNYHLLYEHFLSIFDPKKRFDFGAFYTPPELAAFCVKLTKTLINEEYPKLDLYASSNKLIDPCCGTGNFLEQLIAYSSNQESMPHYIGFEILPAPYALSNYRLSMIRKKLPKPDKLSILLTDTLSDELEKSSGGRSKNLIEEELEQARKLSRPPLTLVIGNPPSSDSAFVDLPGNYKIIEKLLESFRPPKSMRKARQNIQKQLSNHFIKFLRWSCDKLKKSKMGMLTIILPSSFAEQTSYLFARKWLSENFRKLWYFDIDSDGRTGAASNSIFKTLQGRSLLIGIVDEKSDSEASEVFYGTIANHAADEKMKFFQNYEEKQSSGELFRKIDPGENVCFRETAVGEHSLYEKCWKLYSTSDQDNFIFERHCSGLKLAPSGMFVHTSPDHLLRRTRDIANTKLTYAELKEKWFIGQDKPPAKSKFSDQIRQTIGKKLNRKNVVRYSYRPFLDVAAFISEDVLSELAKYGGGGTRYRPEILSAYQDPSVFGFVVAPAPKDIGAKIHRFVSFSWGIPDNDLCKRGNAHIFCNKFPEYKKTKGKWNRNPIVNINGSLIATLNKVFKLSADEIRDKLVFYTYAILCSELYLNEFSDHLFVVAGGDAIPRIPIPKSSKLFQSIARKGFVLAQLEREPDRFSINKNIAAYRKCFTRPFKLTSFKLDEDGGIIKLYEEKDQKITLNNLPKELISYEVSGYNIVQQWLKLHSFRYTRKSFDKEEYVNFLIFLSAVLKQMQAIEEIDKEVSVLLSGKQDLI